MSQPVQSPDLTARIIRFEGKEAVRFVTPSGVTAIVAASISPTLLAALKRKLEHKLRRRGLLPDARL